MARLRIESREGPPQDLELISSEVTIGRGSGNTLHFRDPWLSRCHAAIRHVDDAYLVEDLKSRNGTFLNGRLLPESQPLASGDVITLGDLRITFLDAPSGVLKVADSALSLVGKGTVILNSDDLRLDRYQEAFRQNRRFEHSQPGAGVSTRGENSDSWWFTLNEAASALISHFPIDQLVQRIIELVLKAVPAERGALLLRSGKISGTLEVRAKRGYAEQEEIRISRTIIEVVLEARQALLTVDAQGDRRFDGAVSIMMQGIRSIMCVPIVDNNRNVMGLIYLDDRVSNSIFSETSLKLVGLIASMAAVKIENCFLLEEQIEKKRMEEQLAVGSLIQRKLLPNREPLIAGYEICAGYQSCFEVSGDYYDFLEYDGKLAIVVADISGKGVGAALLMAVLQASLRALANVVSSPAELVKRLNKVLVESSPSNKFATLFFAELDPKTHELEYVSGGHNPSLLAREESVEELKSTGPVVGLVANAQFTSRKVFLEPGATLVCYTDGVTELVNDDDDEFGTERLIETLRSSRKRQGSRLVEIIFENMTSFSRSNRFDDDCTIVTLHRHQT